jgi:soluble P-type ATPase
MQSRDWNSLDAVIDSADGDVAGSIRELLKLRGVFMNYVMTSMEQPRLRMQAIILNLELMASTKGARTEFGEMVRSVTEALGWWWNM